jgi:hypothetical protein
MRRIILLSFVAAAIAGCSQNLTAFSKTGATQQQFEFDRVACLQGARVHSSDPKANPQDYITNWPRYTSCMETRGYIPDPDGTLVPPEAQTSTAAMDPKKQPAH